VKNISFSRNTIVKASAICLGVVLLVAGTGKVLSQGEFTNALEGLFFTQATASLVARYLPWSEIGIGLLLIFGFVPKIMAVVSMGLVSSFIISNLWLLLYGGDTAITCGDCFGIWEKLLGSLSPWQAFMIDLALLGLALVVLTQTRAPARPFRLWSKAVSKT
jgi:uncharacterized membrane protein YphA (DoxX/SURF4 family)